MIVYCVVCVDQHGREQTHIFSTKEKAEQYVAEDTERAHVVYDYVVDEPGRMEDVQQ